jgi:hypothetical protein
MEHRNSTSLTSSGALRNPQQRAASSARWRTSFSTWNMERLRSAVSSRSTSKKPT